MKYHISNDWRRLSDDEIAELDIIKGMEQEFLRKLKELWDAEHLAADKRWLSIARTHIEEASMAARKAVSRPNTVEF